MDETKPFLTAEQQLAKVYFHETAFNLARVHREIIKSLNSGVEPANSIVLMRDELLTLLVELLIKREQADEAAKTDVAPVVLTSSEKKINRAKAYERSQFVEGVIAGASTKETDNELSRLSERVESLFYQDKYAYQMRSNWGSRTKPKRVYGAFEKG